MLLYTSKDLIFDLTIGEGSLWDFYRGDFYRAPYPVA